MALAKKREWWMARLTAEMMDVLTSWVDCDKGVSAMACVVSVHKTRSRDIIWNGKQTRRGEI